MNAGSSLAVRFATSTTMARMSGTITLSPARVVRVLMLPDEADIKSSPWVHLEGPDGWASREHWLPDGDGFTFNSVPFGPLTVVAVYGKEEVLTPILASEDSVTIRAPE